MNYSFQDLQIDQEDTQKQNTFRIYAKKIFLTYSQVDPDMTAEHVLQQLQNIFYGFNYIISKESHGDGEAHFHVLLTNKNKFNIRNARRLDLKFNGKIFHGNYQTVKLLPKVVEYVCKDNHYITNFTNIQDGKLLDEKDFFLQRAPHIGYEKALAEYVQQYPKKALSSASALMKNIKAIKQAVRDAKDPVLDTPFDMQNFHLTGLLKEWADKLYKQKALILVGRSGIGKTQFAKVFCLLHKWKTLVVNHKEDFQKIDESYQAVIIDDANFNDFSDTQKLALIDNTSEKTIRVLYKAVTKNKGIVMMILMNHKQYDQIYELFQEEAYARRSLMVEPTHPFMINVYHIQNNYNTHHGDVIHNHRQNTGPTRNVSIQQQIQEDKRYTEINQKSGQEIHRSAKSL